MPASLFGISGKSNREGPRRTHWGKNEFNSSFPAALLCYMHHVGVDPVYLSLGHANLIEKSTIPVTRLFDMDPLSESAYYAFEQQYPPYQKYVTGTLRNYDLVVCDNQNPSSPHRRGFEVKLTALPDSSTSELPEDRYGCELVIRPPNMEQVAISVLAILEDKKADLQAVLKTTGPVYDWRSQEILARMPQFLILLKQVMEWVIDRQVPFAIQPVWKTKGKTSQLSDDCLDVFVWSNLAFVTLAMERVAVPSTRMTRPTRAVLWLVRILHDFATFGRIDPTRTSSEMAYELQTDKAFSVNGNVTWKYLKGSELTRPRLPKSTIAKIILGGGQTLLSPERRFDAVIVNTPNLFDGTV